MSKKAKLPPLTRLSNQESEAIASMYRMFDYAHRGRIAPHLARNLISNLGYNTSFITFGRDVTLNEILILLDKVTPETETVLEGNLITFNGLVAEDRKEEGRARERVLHPQSISNFMESLGRPPASINECTLLLNSMLDYDDCSEHPVLKADYFNREIMLFAKKNNLVRELR